MLTLTSSPWKLLILLLLCSPAAQNTSQVFSTSGRDSCLPLRTDALPSLDTADIDDLQSLLRAGSVSSVDLVTVGFQDW